MAKGHGPLRYAARAQLNDTASLALAERSLARSLVLLETSLAKPFADPVALLAADFAAPNALCIASVIPIPTNQESLAIAKPWGVGRTLFS